MANLLNHHLLRSHGTFEDLESIENTQERVSTAGTSLRDSLGPPPPPPAMVTHVTTQIIQQVPVNSIRKFSKEQNPVTWCMLFMTFWHVTGNEPNMAQILPLHIADNIHEWWCTLAEDV